MSERERLAAFFRIPSPVHEVKFDAFRERNVEVFMKRDDLIHPIVSGNKWRKLQGYVKQAQEQECHSIITYGGAFSNHLVATAAAGAILGLKTTGIIRGNHADLNNPVLTLCRLFGMSCKRVSNVEYDELHRIERIEKGCYYIPEGGYGKPGILGCKAIIEELQDSYNHIFCAVGTGTTLAGMSEALLEKGREEQLHGISVLKGATSLESEIKSLTPQANFSLYHEFHHGGYAQVSDELSKFIKDFTGSTGVLLDPVYTGKMMYAVKTLVEQGVIKDNSRVLCLHTGGLTGLMNDRMLRYFAVEG